MIVYLNLFLYSITQDGTIWSLALAILIYWYRYWSRDINRYILILNYLPQEATEPTLFCECKPFGPVAGTFNHTTQCYSLNSDAALCCEVKHDDKLTDEDGIYIQVSSVVSVLSSGAEPVCRSFCSGAGANI